MGRTCMQAIKATGNGSSEFNPHQWLSEDFTECTVNAEMGNFVFGKGARNCLGKNLAVTELITFLAILGREVSSIEMSQEVQQTEFSILGDHPSGMPLKLVPSAP